MSTLTSIDEQAIRHKLEVDWPELSVRQDVDGRLAMLSDDFVYMPQDHPVVHGKAETRAFLEGFPSIPHMAQSLEALSGTTDLVVARGTFELVLDLEGTSVSGTGKFLCTATLKDGEWLFTASCFNWDAPPEPGD